MLPPNWQTFEQGHKAWEEGKKEKGKKIIRPFFFLRWKLFYQENMLKNILLGKHCLLYFHSEFPSDKSHEFSFTIIYLPFCNYDTTL